MKKTPSLFFISSFLCGLLLCNSSCNNAEVAPVTRDSGATVITDKPTILPDSTAARPTDTPHQHHTIARTDTGSGAGPRPKPIVRPAPDALKQAVLGYSYFKEMKRMETKYIHAFISIAHPESKVKDTLKALNAADGLEKGNDTTSIFTKNMNIYRYVDVSLVNAGDSAFKVVKIHDAARQEIDSLSGNHWEWAVTPTTDEKTGILVLKVVAEKPDGSKEAFQAQSIPIKIDVQRNLLRRVWNYMIDNPGIVLTAILIPVLGFLGRSLFNRKKKNEDPENKTKP